MEGSNELNAAHWKIKSRFAKIEIIHRKCFLIATWIVLGGVYGKNGARLVEHKVATYLVGTIGQAIWVRRACAAQKKRSGINGAARNNHNITLKLSGFAASNLCLHRGDLTTIWPSDQPHDMRVGDQRDIVLVMNRAHAIHVGVGLGVHHAWISVAGVAANALAVHHVLLINIQTNRNRKWMVPKLGHAVEQFLNARLIADRWEWIFRF